MAAKNNKKILRRDFIKKASTAIIGASIAPYFIPDTALGKSGNVAPSNRIVMGSIGVGSMGSGNLSGFLEKKEVQMVAVCDVDKGHRLRAKAMTNAKYGNNACKDYIDYRDLLARDDIDAVMIATPDHWHALIAVAAARAGKDIYGEKPLAYNVAEGRAMVDAVQKYGRIWQTGSWQRSQRHFRFACELVRNGRIGKVDVVRVGLPHGNGVIKGKTGPEKIPDGLDFNFWLGPAPKRPYNHNFIPENWRWVRDYSSGQLTDWAGHHCDIALWGMNAERSAPVRIHGQAEFPSAEDGLYNTPPSYWFEAEYAEGFKMIVADAHQQPRGMGAQFLGEKGWIHVNRNGITTYPESIINEKIRPSEIHLYKSDDHKQNFLDCVRSRAETITPVDKAYHSILVAHLGMVAMTLDREVEWNKDIERFVGDQEADRLLRRPMRAPWNLKV